MANQFFGRAYELSLTTKNNSETIVISSSEWEPEALRFTFEVQQWANQAFWMADIKIYNGDGQIQSGPSKGTNLYQTVINLGDIVTLKAGYKDGNYDIVWVGEIYQPIWTQENVVDATLELRSAVGINLGPDNFININVPALATQRQQAAIIANQATTPIPYDPAQLEYFSTKQLPRPKHAFGNPVSLLHDLARDNQLSSWVDFHGIQFAQLTQEGLGGVVASYAPAYSPGSIPQTAANGVTLSLIGAPQQTDIGVDFCVLMDARMKVKSPFNQVQIDLDAIKQYPIQINPNTGKGQLIRPLAKNGQYIIIGVRHVGDTRGREWHSYVTGIVSVSNFLQLFA